MTENRYTLSDEDLYAGSEIICVDIGDAPDHLSYYTVGDIFTITRVDENGVWCTANNRKEGHLQLWGHKIIKGAISMLGNEKAKFIPISKMTEKERMVIKLAGHTDWERFIL